MSEPPPPQRDASAPDTDTAGQENEGLLALSPFPDHRDLYLLVAGIILGALLSGAVLGNVSPAAHHRLFIGGYELQRQLEQMQREHLQVLDRLEASGVTEVAVEEQRREFESERIPLQAELQQARNDHLDRLAGLAGALILAVGLVMVLEALVSPRAAPGQRVPVPRALSRLISIRYALLAMWGALVIARPALLGDLSLLFLVLLIALALFVAIIPLGRRAPA